MSAEIHQLAIFAARRDAADRLREEQIRLLREIAAGEAIRDRSAWEQIGLMTRIARLSAIGREIEELGQ